MALTHQSQELEERPVPLAGWLLAAATVLHVARTRPAATTPSLEGAYGSHCFILVAGAG